MDIYETMGARNADVRGILSGLMSPKFVAGMSWPYSRSGSVSTAGFTI